MPKIVRQWTATRPEVFGRLSDGSDRTIKQLTEWFVEAVDDAGQLHSLKFDHDPLPAELWADLPTITKPTPTTKAQWETYLEDLYCDWLRWRTTRVEAQARTMAALVITALTNRENMAWTAYTQGIQAWRAAT